MRGFRGLQLTRCQLGLGEHGQQGNALRQGKLPWRMLARRFQCLFGLAEVTALGKYGAFENPCGGTAIVDRQ
jgi:hypothetical protein